MKRSIIAALLLLPFASNCAELTTPGKIKMSPQEAEVTRLYNTCQYYHGDKPGVKWKAGYENCEKVEQQFLNMQSGKDKQDIDALAGKHR